MTWGLFKGGLTEGGRFHTPVRGTMFGRNGAVTPGPSSDCDITFFVKGLPKSARQSRDSTMAARRVQSVTVPSSRVSRECRSPEIRSPPFTNARLTLRTEKQPEEKVFGRDVPGTSGTQTSGYPGQKLCACGLFLLFLTGSGPGRPGIGSGRPGLGKILCKKTLG